MGQLTDSGTLSRVKPESSVAKTVSATNAKTIKVSSCNVACSGDTAIAFSPHPRVYLKIPSADGSITCPYCGTVFSLNELAR